MGCSVLGELAAPPPRPDWQKEQAWQIPRYATTRPSPISEHSRVLIAMHKAMRTDSQRLIRAVDALPASDTHQAAALGRAFGAIVGLIHDHHWTEDDVMYPFLLERVPTFESDAIRLEDDHVELDAAMARINARFRLLAHQVSARLWQDTRGHLLDEATAFDRVLVDHLDREEAVVVPPFESLLSEADQQPSRRRRPSSPPTGTCAWPCPGSWPTQPRRRRQACERPLPACSASSRTGSGSRGSLGSWPRFTSRDSTQQWSITGGPCMNQRRRSYRTMQLRGPRRQQPPVLLLAAVRVGAAAAGAAAVGAGAVGALAVGRLAVGRAAVRRLKIEDLEVTRLHVHELRVDQQPAAAQPGVPPTVQT